MTKLIGNHVVLKTVVEKMAQIFLSADFSFVIGFDSENSGIDHLIFRKNSETSKFENQ